jgi:hypothetical protein
LAEREDDLEWTSDGACELEVELAQLLVIMMCKVKEWRGKYRSVNERKM